MQNTIKDKKKGIKKVISQECVIQMCNRLKDLKLFINSSIQKNYQNNIYLFAFLANSKNHLQK